MGEGRELLYVGKAVSIRRRLLDHARATDAGTRHEHMVSRTQGAGWVECPDEDEARCLEADLLVALTPPYNAALDDPTARLLRNLTSPDVPACRRRALEQDLEAAERFYPAVLGRRTARSIHMRSLRRARP